MVVPSVTNGYPVTSIGPLAFYGKNVTDVTLPNSITSIGEAAFCNAALTNINIPSAVVTLGSYAFENCGSLASVTLGDGLTSIGTNTFYDDSRLRNLVIPNGVISIGPFAFGECQNLTNIVMSARLISISSDAFNGDTFLESIYFLGNAPSAPANLFSYNYFAIVYYLPQTTGWTNTFGGAPAVLWTPQLPAMGITTYSNQPVVILPYLAQSIGMHFQLQMTTNLNSANWVTVTNGVQFIGVQITNAPSPAYFRLQLQ